MKGISDYAVVYDISSDRERRRVEKVLKGFGFRVQRSVFECRLNKGGKRELITKLEKIGVCTGFIKIYKLDYTCHSCVIGEGAQKSMDEGHAFIV